MKLFLKRTEEGGFCFLDESARELYNVKIETSGSKQKITLADNEGMIFSNVTHRLIPVDNFTVRCNGKIYILLPQNTDCFSFKIYGSSYAFCGDMISGSFSMFDVDKTAVVTMKKCWSRIGDGYELHLYSENNAALALSVCVCAAMYIGATPGAVPI